MTWDSWAGIFYSHSLLNELNKTIRFPVHGVSVNNTNHLINGDNKGYAAYLAEKLMNKSSFIAAFAQSNEGDVSPNTLGAFCTGTDIPCDGSRDTACPEGSVCHGR